MTYHPLRAVFFTLFLVTAVRSVAAEYTFTTIAGQANEGAVDGTGTAARFQGANSITRAPNGVLYVADTGNSTLRKVTPTGVVTTFAGMAHREGWADGVGGVARFQNPQGITSDTAGNLYVADSNGHTIRQVTPTGVVTTVAGQPSRNGGVDGVGGDAQFYFPTAIAIGADGTLYVADTNNHTIRKIALDGTVSTLAGSAGKSGVANGTGAEARFQDPLGVAVDAGGNVYVADTGNSVIRKITPAGVVSTFAGKMGEWGLTDGSLGEARFAFPWGLAFDSDGTLWICEPVNGAIRQITGAGVVKTIAFTSGRSVVPDGSGNAFVVDNDRLKKVTSTGKVTVVAGPTGDYSSRDGNGVQARFQSPMSIVRDAVGNLFVADLNGLAVRKIGMDGAVTTWAGSLNGNASTAGFLGPWGLALDRNGNLLVSDSGDKTIRKITPAGVVSTVAGSSGKMGSADGSGTAARFGTPAGIAIDGDGYIYVADMLNNTIRKIAPSGVVTTLAGKTEVKGLVDGVGEQARFSNPQGLAVDAAGTVYVADTNNNAIRKISPAGAVSTLAGLREGFSLPVAVTFDNSGRLLVVDSGDNTISRLEEEGSWTRIAGVPDFFGGNVDGPGDAAQFYRPTAIAVDAAGNIFISDSGNNQIRQGVPAGTVPLAIAAASVSRTIAVATTTRFSVEATGSPALTYQWERRVAGTRIFAALSDGGVFSGTRTPTLKISAATLAMSGDEFRCLVSDGTIPTLFSLAAKLTVVTPPSITAQPSNQLTTPGGAVTFRVTASSDETLSYQWYRNGEPVSGAKSRTFSIPSVGVAQTGQYFVRVSDGAVSVDSQPAILAVATSAKLMAAGTEVGSDIVHPSGRIFDQVLLEGATVAVRADAEQVMRVSFVDLDDDIVQVEFAGAGSLALTIADRSGPALPLNYNQAVNYVKGHAGILITDADETTNVSVFSVGRTNAVNQALFRDEVSYDGVADIAFISISSSNGKFGGVRTANAHYFNSSGFAGLYAPGVQFTGPIYLGEISAFDSAKPVLMIGSAETVQITGGDCYQDNDRVVTVSGVKTLKFVGGTTSHGKPLPAQSNKGRFEDNGRDVTAAIVSNPGN